MRYLISKWAFLLFIIVTTTQCTTGSTGSKNINLDGTFTKTDLENSSIFTLYHRSNTLFTGSDEGVFANDLTTSATQWSYLGLGTDSTRVVDIIAWNSQEMMVAIRYDEYHTNNEVLLKTRNSGEEWISLTENFTGDNINNSLSRLALDLDEPNKIFALGGLPIARSTDRGQSWEAVFETWQLAAFGHFITIDQQNPDIIWSGGATNIFTPTLVKSTDGGNSWVRLNEKLQIFDDVVFEAIAYDLIIKQNQPSDVLLGISPGIFRSVDGGQSWDSVFDDASVLTLTRNAQNPQIVYASGGNDDGTLFFAASGDFGDTWETVAMPDSPASIQVNDMVSVMEDGQEVLYLGTNKGLYSYRFEE